MIEPNTIEVSDPENQAVIPLASSVDASYVASGAAPEFDGERLEPWTGRRRAACFELGFSGNSPLDPIRLLYSCLLTKAQVALVFRRPDTVIESMLTWAEQHKCADPTRPNFSAAVDIATAIFQEVETSSFKPETSNTPTGN